MTADLSSDTTEVLLNGAVNHQNSHAFSLACHRDHTLQAESGTIRFIGKGLGHSQFASQRVEGVRGFLAIRTKRHPLTQRS